MLEFQDLIQTSAKDAQERVNRWKENNISGVINLAHNIPFEMKYDSWLPVLRHPHLDEVVPEPIFFGPILAFYDWARTKGKVIIHCQAGGNRSVGTAAVILVARHNMTPQQALATTGNPGYHHWSDGVYRFANSMKKK